MYDGPMNINANALVSKANDSVSVATEFVSMISSDFASKVSEVAHKIAEPIGEIAAYVFWVTSILVMLGFFVIVFTYDTEMNYIVGQVYSLIAATMLISIGIMAICSKVLKNKS